MVKILFELRMIISNTLLDLAVSVLKGEEKKRLAVVVHAYLTDLIERDV